MLKTNMPMVTNPPYISISPFNSRNNNISNEGSYSVLEVKMPLVKKAWTNEPGGAVCESLAESSTSNIITPHSEAFRIKTSPKFRDTAMNIQDEEKESESQDH
jgi:hypothetical protein